MLERRQKLIKLANQSEYVWWTVEEYELGRQFRKASTVTMGKNRKSGVPCGEEAEKGCSQDDLK